MADDPLRWTYSECCHAIELQLRRVQDWIWGEGPTLVEATVASLKLRIAAPNQVKLLDSSLDFYNVNANMLHARVCVLAVAVAVLCIVQNLGTVGRTWARPPANDSPACLGTTVGRSRSYSSN